MPESFYPKVKALVPLYEALKGDQSLNAEARKVGLTLVRLFRSTSKWHPKKQSEIREDMSQPNISRAIRRLVAERYIERRRRDNSQRECSYRPGTRIKL